MTKLYCRIDHFKEYEFYHLCSDGRLNSHYHKENTRYPNKCPKCFFQIPSIYLMGENNVEIRILGSYSTIKRGIFHGLGSNLKAHPKIVMHELPVL